VTEDRIEGGFEQLPLVQDLRRGDRALVAAGAG
jgi:hypothetical protein